MKTLFIALLLMVSVSVQAQIFSRRNEVTQKVTLQKSEIVGSVDVDKKLVEVSWKEHLARYGTPVESKGQIIVPSAYIPAVSPEPLRIFSRVSNSRGWTTLAMTLELFDGSTIDESHPKYGEASKFLDKFLQKTQQISTVKEAELGISQSEKAYQGVMEASAAMSRDYQSVKREIEETKLKLAGLEEDKKVIEAAMVRNKEEMKKIAADRETKKKSLVDARSKME